MSMSLPPSSFARPTQASVPASQNTAPVIKFRCLYTHDIRRKAKRWQDGYLKFHTFNKRAMVYDEGGNFIGDHHWRESHDIQDGDELELDKGVLIQVSECMETTQTDISVLFDKRKASQESPQRQKTPAPPSTGFSSHPRQPVTLTRPLKSLNDVLGIQRAPIGRSVTPQSPYEQCHRRQGRVEHRQQEEERPAKRQKPAPTPDVLQRKSTNKVLRSQPDVVDLENSSLAKPVSKVVPVPGVKKDPKKSNSSSKTTQVASSEEVPSSEQPSLPAQKISARSISNGDDTLEKAPPVLSEKSKSRLNNTEIPLNPLRMRSEKPRQKLMYKALPPPKASKNNHSGEAQTNSNQANGDDDRFRDPDVDFSLSASTFAVLEEMNTDVSRRIAEDSDATTQRNRTPKLSRSQNSQRRLLTQIPTHATVYGSLASSAGVEIGDELADGLGPLPSSSPDKQRHEHNELPTADHTGLVVRSNSDISHMVTETDPMFIETAPRRTLASLSAAEAISTAAIRRSERKLFRKSHSDANALRNRDNENNGPSRPLATRGPPREEINNINNSAAAAHSNETGPWSVEALDFFDWWPPGRPKPV